MATIRACGVMSRFGASLRTLTTPQTRYRDTKRPIVSFRSLSWSTEGENRTNGEETFAEMMAKSRLLTSCGSSPVGHKVLGKIIAVVDDNLYIDFGGKFHGVVPCPEFGSEIYVVGTKVEVIVKDLEMSAHFLGAPQDSSLLEARIKLVGLLREFKMNLISNSKTGNETFYEDDDDDLDASFYDDETTSIYDDNDEDDNRSITIFQ
ncbi:PREDICTED: 28S ribosomal protein S28, mitochondrial-like [Amphimedon queenslandica]|uniref:S1 motif domain-containing protein n=1 Tax=Amphimedon queenslandica TaxID=400682 RepID=A0AAN0IAN9_AMPQE|nr:PREDICTED: 28S ribosomal protein S28, mitochondrial-like [Amphimedon queenslandica]|eukprot:XP_003384067.3 PREDICTED: 28S ribosomal protein S28, mitochondrial-like [Amphimedon queenslandica]